MAARVTRQDLAKVIGDKTMSVSDSAELAKQIAAYVVSENVSVDMSSLIRDVMQYRLEEGFVEAVAVSAHEISPAVRKDVEDILRSRFPQAKSIKVDTRIDDTLVGGLRVELPRETLDLSVRSKLNLFKRLVAEGVK